MQTFTSECLDPGFGHENGDGYVRIIDKPRPRGGQYVMRHRWFWELFNGPIPEGMELDHLCKNRRCCNHEHLELITRTDHAITTNKERYEDTIALGVKLLRGGKPKGYVCEVTNRKLATINSWIRNGWV